MHARLIALLVVAALHACCLPAGEDLEMSAGHPVSVVEGVALTLELSIQNRGSSALGPRMMYIDLGEGLYDGFEVLASDPEWVYLIDDDVRQRHLLAYDLALQPGANPIRLTLKGRKAGRHDGLVVWYRAVRRHPAGDEVAVPITVTQAQGSP